MSVVFSPPSYCLSAEMIAASACCFFGMVTPPGMFLRGASTAKLLQFQLVQLSGFASLSSVFASSGLRGRLTRDRICRLLAASEESSRCSDDLRRDSFLIVFPHEPKREVITTGSLFLRLSGSPSFRPWHRARAAMPLTFRPPQLLPMLDVPSRCPRRTTHRHRFLESPI